MSNEIKMALIITLLLIASYIFLSATYEDIRGPVEGSIAVSQLEDSNTAYAVSRAASTGRVLNWIYTSVIASIVLVWFRVIFLKIKQRSKQHEENHD